MVPKKVIFVLWVFLQRNSLEKFIEDICIGSVLLRQILSRIVEIASTRVEAVIETTGETLRNRNLFNGKLFPFAPAIQRFKISS